MPSRVTTRFYRVTGLADQTPVLETVLQQLSEIAVLKDRFRNAGSEDGEEMQVRLERLAHDGDFWTGEFTRLQSEDVPATVTDDGLIPTDLQDGLGLGHCAAFVFHAPTRVLALQINMQSVRHLGISGYLHAYHAAAQYALAPIPVRDVWADYNGSNPRKFEITIASPENLDAVDDQDETVIESFQRFGEIYGGHVITVQVSVGQKQEVTLAKDVVGGFIRRVLGMKAGGADIRKVKVTSDQKNAVGEYEEINFLREFIQEKANVQLPNDNAQENFQLRSQAVRAALDRHLPYFREIYIRR